MRKYGKLTKKLAKVVFPLINRDDWGVKCINDKSPRPSTTNEAYNNFFLSQGTRSWPRKFTQTHIEEHLNGEAVYYFRGRASQGKCLVMLDIDAHKQEESEQDAEKCAQFVKKKFLKNAYIEPSTNGRGRHVYIVVDKKACSPKFIKEQLKYLARAIRAFSETKKWNVTVDKFCGTPTHFTRDKRGTVSIETSDRGILGKLPTLPRGEESIDELKNTAVFEPIDLKNITERINVETNKIREKNDTTPGTEKQRVCNILTKSDEAHDACFDTSPLSINRIRSEKCAFKRMHFACCQFRFIRGRIPNSIEELTSFYIKSGFSFGAPVNPQRDKRAKDVIKFQKALDESNIQFNFGINLGHQTRLVKKVIPEIPKGINYEDLAIVLYVVEKNALSMAGNDRWQFTTGNDAIIAMFRSLKASGASKRGCNYNKAVACKKLLVEFELISEEDSTWEFQGNRRGRCKKFGLGVKHPFLKNFIAIREKCEERKKEKSLAFALLRSAGSSDGLLRDLLLDGTSPRSSRTTLLRGRSVASCGSSSFSSSSSGLPSGSTSLGGCSTLDTGSLSSDRLLGRRLGGFFHYGVRYAGLRSTNKRVLPNVDGETTETRLNLIKSGCRYLPKEGADQHNRLRFDVEGAVITPAEKIVRPIDRGVGENPSLNHTIDKEPTADHGRLKTARLGLCSSKFLDPIEHIPPEIKSDEIGSYPSYLHKRKE
jgi:hypothetical protein